MESSKIENQTLLKKFIAIFKKQFLTWEWMLVVVLIVVNLINISLSESYFNFENITNAIKIFLDKAIMALPLMMVLIAGEIDISIASIMGVAGVCMGLANAAGMPFYIIILIGMVAGTLCGLFNGFLVTRFPELSSVIITLGNLILFRGIAFMTLENKAVTDFPQQITFFAWGKIGGIPFILIFFIIEAIFFVYIIHRTKFGRSLYAIGNNKITSKFSGLKTDKLKIIVFVVSGLFAGIASIFLLSKLGSARASMGTGYEMEVLAMVILGGVSATGGKGRAVGVILAIFIIGLLRFGLGMANISAEVIMIVLGALLIVAVAIPNFRRFLQESNWFVKLQQLIANKK